MRINRRRGLYSQQSSLGLVKLMLTDGTEAKTPFLCVYPSSKHLLQSCLISQRTSSWLIRIKWTVRSYLNTLVNLLTWDVVMRLLSRTSFLLSRLRVFTLFIYLTSIFMLYFFILKTLFLYFHNIKTCLTKIILKLVYF